MILNVIQCIEYVEEERRLLKSKIEYLLWAFDNSTKYQHEYSSWRLVELSYKVRC